MKKATCPLMIGEACFQWSSDEKKKVLLRRFGYKHRVALERQRHGKEESEIGMNMLVEEICSDEKGWTICHCCDFMEEQVNLEECAANINAPVQSGTFNSEQDSPRFCGVCTIM
jgi:hypothetical protein